MIYPIDGHTDGYRHMIQADVYDLVYFLQYERAVNRVINASKLNVMGGSGIECLILPSDQAVSYW